MTKSALGVDGLIEYIIPKHKRERSEDCIAEWQKIWMVLAMNCIETYLIEQPRLMIEK